MSMELRDYVDVVRKRWRIIALVTIAFVALSSLWTMTTPRLYASTTQFFVSTAGDTNAASLQQGNSFTQARVKSYAQLLELPLILDPVIASTGLQTSAEQLARQVTSTIPLDTVVIDDTRFSNVIEKGAGHWRDLPADDLGDREGAG